MSIVRKLLEIIVAGRTVSATGPLLTRLIIGMAALTFLAIFAAVMLSFLVSMALWLSYNELIAHGFSSGQAFGMVAAVLLLLLAIAGISLQYYWQKSTTLIRRIVALQSPLGNRINTLRDAFLNGYNYR